MAKKKIMCPKCNREAKRVKNEFEGRCDVYYHSKEQEMPHACMDWLEGYEEHGKKHKEMAYAVHLSAMGRLPFHVAMQKVAEYEALD